MLLRNEPALSNGLQQRRVLNSWKEIAAYVGRGVRTVQRYEGAFAFPIHRPAQNRRSSVMAFTDEVDNWLSSTPKNQIPFEIKKLDTQPTLEEIERQLKASRATLQRLEQMRKDLAQISDGIRRRNPASTGTAA